MQKPGQIWHAKGIQSVRLELAASGSQADRNGRKSRRLSWRCGRGDVVSRSRRCTDAWCPAPASSWYVTARRSAGRHGSSMQQQQQQQQFAVSSSHSHPATPLIADRLRSKLRHCPQRILPTWNYSRRTRKKLHLIKYGIKQCGPKSRRYLSNLTVLITLNLLEKQWDFDVFTSNGA